MRRLLEYLKEAFEALMRNKARTILTMLGMLIGVAAVLSVYGLSSGASAAIKANVNSGNNPSLAIAPDPQQANPAIAQLRFRDYVVVKDALGALAQRITPYFAPQFGGSNVFQLRHHSQHVVALAYSWYGGDERLQVQAGRNLSPEDQRAGANVVLINHDLAVQFYGGDDRAVGQNLDVHGTRFTIAGVANASEGTGANEFGGTYFFVLPFTTFHNFQPESITGIYIWLASASDEDQAKQVVLDTLHRTHGKRAVYDVQSNRQQLEGMKKALDTVSVGLTAIGAISLLVAGIGIMNIMLVSVTERTREIGIRKSIGASRADIVLQFLSEAALMSLIGGLSGFGLSLLVLSAAGGALAAKMGPLLIPYGELLFYGLSFSILIGVTFGVYPAMRASRLDPVEALRS